MNNPEPSNKLLVKLKNNKVIIVLILLVVVMIIILTTLLLLNKKDKSTDTEVSNSTDSTAKDTNENTDEGFTPLLEIGICPDTLTFTPSLLAELEGKKYNVSGEGLSWIEANCPDTVNESKGTPESNSALLWSYNGNDWVANGEVPDCSEPLEIMTPIDMSLVSGMLYPGQVRGTDYKPHGGFAFDNQSNNSVAVKLPDDAVLWRATRYIQDGEVQYMVDFITDCGIAYRFDHFLTLSDRLMEIMNTLPEPTESTFTTYINPPIEFSKGEVLATEVGFRNTLNVGFDFGVYDLRSRNAVSQNDAAWAELHKDEAEYAFYAICWLDNLAGNDKVTARALKARGAYGDEGKESDYCN